MFLFAGPDAGQTFSASLATLLTKVYVIYDNRTITNAVVHVFDLKTLIMFARAPVCVCCCKFAPLVCSILA